MTYTKCLIEKNNKGIINIKQVQRSSVLRTNDCFIKKPVCSTCIGVDGENLCDFFLPLSVKIKRILLF